MTGQSTAVAVATATLAGARDKTHLEPKIVLLLLLITYTNIFLFTGTHFYPPLLSPFHQEKIQTTAAGSEGQGRGKETTRVGLETHA